MIDVRLGELAETEAGALLQPITAFGAAATSAARRLEIAAGSVPTSHLARFGELPVGAAMITPAGLLTAGYLIHLVVRSAEQPVTAAVVRQCLINAWRRLDEWGIDSVALPLLGTGAGNLDPEESARLVVTLLRELSGTSPRRVCIVVENDYEMELIERELAHPARGHSVP